MAKNEENEAEMEASVETMEDCDSKQRMTWSNTLEFVVSLIGYSTGMSDFWRFPFLVWRNGGGAFLFAYGTTLLACGIPLYFLEVAMGQYAGKGVFEIWGFFPLFKGIGISIAILNLAFVTYISTMRYWLLEYIRHSFTNELPCSSCGHTWNTNSCISSQKLFLSGNNGSLWSPTANTTELSNQTLGISSEEEFWKHKVLSLSGSIEEIGSMRWYLVMWAVVVKLFVIICLIKSVKTLGKLMLLTTCLPFLVGLAMLIQSCQYKGVQTGILYLFAPDFTKLTQSKVWLEATFMAFYSLGPGWGGVIMMGSHMKFHSNCLRNVYWSCWLHKGIKLPPCTLYLGCGVFLSCRYRRIRCRGGDRVDLGLKDMIGRKMPHLFRLVAAFVSPVLFLLLLLISFVTYRPPKYGAYEYPEYTRVIGWLFSCLIVIPIPLHIIWQFFKLQGTLKERWITLTQPSSDWGPSGSAHRLDYLGRSQTKRSFTDIAFYNFFGKQRHSVKKQCEAVALY